MVTVLLLVGLVGNQTRHFRIGKTILQADASPRASNEGKAVHYSGRIQ